MNLGHYRIVNAEIQRCLLLLDSSWFWRGAGRLCHGRRPGPLAHPPLRVSYHWRRRDGLIVMSPKKVLIDLIRGVLQSIKGTPYNKGSYEDLFKMLYSLFRTARREGSWPWNRIYLIRIKAPSSANIRNLPITIMP